MKTEEKHEFQSEDYFHLFVESSIGRLPVKIGILEVKEPENEEDDLPIEIEFAIDENHPEYKDIESVPQEEALLIMNTLHEEIPKRVSAMLEEAAKRVIEEHGEEV